MKKGKLNKDEKASELKKYRALILVTLDYYIENMIMKTQTDEFDLEADFNSLKMQTEEHFQKGRLTKLKQWFRDITEMQIEDIDLKFNEYLQEKTQYDIDIFKAYFQRIDKIIARNKIISDNEFYDVNIMVNQLCQAEPIDEAKIKVLTRLLSDYEQRK